MNKSLKYWLWNCEEIVGMTVVIGVLLGLMMGFLNNDIYGGLSLSGVAITSIVLIWMIINCAQSGKIMMISVMFSDSRKSSFAGMQLMIFAALIQIEFVQLVIYEISGLEETVQKLILIYTPVLFILMSAIGFLLAILEENHEKLYQVFSIIVMALSSAAVGFCYAFAAGKGMIEIEGNLVNRYEMLTGIPLIILGVSAVLLYILSAYLYRRKWLSIDVKV